MADPAEGASEADDPLGDPTVAPNLLYTFKGFEEDRSREVTMTLGNYVHVFSRIWDLSTLDGVTVAYDYKQALLDLDRGYESSHQLTPSDGIGVGIAMTPSVIRDGKLKSHIVLNAGVIEGLMDEQSEWFGSCVHTVAHECAHVEITAFYDRAFPNVLLRAKLENSQELFRSQIILACWDEFAACWHTGTIGYDPTDAYAETFLQTLKVTRENVISSIKAFRTHGIVNRVLTEVYHAYGDILKYASYLLGIMTARGIKIDDLPAVRDALVDHWFHDYFQRLEELCVSLAKQYGEWTDKGAFEAIGDLADELVTNASIHITVQQDGRLYVEIPHTLETLGDGMSPEMARLMGLIK